MGAKIAQIGLKLTNNMDFCSPTMQKKGSNGRKIAATRSPGKTGATGIIKKTDKAERPVRTGKTGPTGIIRESGANGVPDLVNGVGPTAGRASKAASSRAKSK